MQQMQQIEQLFLLFLATFDNSNVEARVTNGVYTSEEKNRLFFFYQSVSVRSVDVYFSFKTSWIIQIVDWLGKPT